MEKVDLNNRSPYEAALGFVGEKNLSKLGIFPVPYDEIVLSVRLLKK